MSNEKGHGRRMFPSKTVHRNPPVPAEEGAVVFRSPAAVAIWWVWVLFAVANLVDLAVQGRDHLSVVAAFILLFITGVVYVTAWRPRVIVDATRLTIVNPLGEHRAGWAAVAAADTTELLRVRFEWPDGDQTGRRAIYAWAAHSSRRRQVTAEMRAQRQARRGARGFGGGALGGGAFGGGQPVGYGTPPGKAPDPVPLGVDTDRVVATITAHAEQARLDAPGVQATAPVSTWNWLAIAAVVGPGLALLIAALA